MLPESECAFQQMFQCNRLQACLEKGGGRRDDVQPPAGNASVADEDSLFVNGACLESAKVHHGRPGLQCA